MPHKILVVNPGSTSTKIGVFNGGSELFVENLTHSNEELAAFPTVASQYAFREKHIREALASRGFNLADVAISIGVGCLIARFLEIRDKGNKGRLLSG